MLKNFGQWPWADGRNDYANFGLYKLFALKWPKLEPTTSTTTTNNNDNQRQQQRTATTNNHHQPPQPPTNQQQTMSTHKNLFGFILSEVIMQIACYVLLSTCLSNSSVSTDKYILNLRQEQIELHCMGLMDRVMFYNNEGIKLDHIMVNLLMQRGWIGM